MKKDDIVLPPMPPVARSRAECGAYLFAEYQVREYTRSAIEPYRQRIAELEAELQALLRQRVEHDTLGCPTSKTGIYADRQRKGGPIGNVEIKDGLVVIGVDAKCLGDGVNYLYTAPQPIEEAFCAECGDGLVVEDPGICGTCYETKYVSPQTSDWRLAAMDAVSHLDYESGAPNNVLQALRVLKAALNGQPYDSYLSVPLEPQLAESNLSTSMRSGKGPFMRGADLVKSINEEQYEPMKVPSSFSVTQTVKCDGNHAFPPCDDPKCWHGKVNVRHETVNEHIARDIREGRFPEKSDRKTVPMKEQSGDDYWNGYAEGQKVCRDRYEGIIADHRRLVRELDVLLNGYGAAEQASLCDIVAQVHREGIKAARPEDQVELPRSEANLTVAEAKELLGLPENIHRIYLGFGLSVMGSKESIELIKVLYDRVENHIKFDRFVIPSDDEIREIFLANGFTLKPGSDDLKPYVYKSARALIARCEHIYQPQYKDDNDFHANASLPELDAWKRGWDACNTSIEAEGWQLVPKEPTDEMLVDAMEASLLGRPSPDDDSYVRSIVTAWCEAAPKFGEAE